MVGRRTTRADETRDSEIREILDNLDKSVLDSIGEHEVPDGFEYRWCRQTVNGYEDGDNISVISRLGWKAVPASRHPGFNASGSIFDRPEDREGHQKGYIEHRGLVLCERPIAIGQAIAAKRAREDLEILQSTPGMENLATGFVRENRVSRSVAADFQE